MLETIEGGGAGRGVEADHVLRRRFSEVDEHAAGHDPHGGVEGAVYEGTASERCHRD